MSESFSTPLEIQVGQALAAHGLTLATAESCTGGLIGHLLTNIPGSSSYYLGGVISYANEVKQQVLGVPVEILVLYGAVSEQTALEMARGVRVLLQADLGVAVTGIAGPGGGTPEKPVGTTWVAVSTPWGDQAQKYTWTGDRLENKAASAVAALELVLSALAPA